jgi:hypothetical protein
MLLRAALILPLVLCALVVIALVPMTEPPVRTGLADDQRTGLMLLMPPLYLFGSAWASAEYASWFWGWRPLPGWLRSFLGPGPLGSPNRREWIVDGRIVMPPNASARRRVWIVVAVFFTACLYLALFVPVYAVLLLWLRSDVYRPWEAAIWAASGIGTLLWLAFLGYRYLWYR